MAKDRKPKEGSVPVNWCFDNSENVQSDVDLRNVPDRMSDGMSLVQHEFVIAHSCVKHALMVGFMVVDLNPLH